jgi:hypothetical protein
MARIKMAHIVAEIRGKIGGTVFSRNRAGAYIREKVTPINPQSSSQTEVRGFFAQVAQAWRGLTDAQRLQWKTAVSNFKGTNIFGDVKTLTGSQLHQKLNLNILNIGGSEITTPPLPSSVPAMESMSAVADNSDNTLVITYSPAIDAGVTMEIFATAPVSAGKSFVKSEFKKLGNFLAADVSPLDVSTEYIAKFGAIGAVGQKIFIKALPIVTLSGIAGSALQCETTIVA